jgi:hypothetical protein
MADDARTTLLRNIAFGSDPQVTPRDRLEALARLDEDRPPPIPDDDLPFDPDEVAELDALLRDVYGGLQVAAAVRGEERFPETLRTFERAVERRARELSDAGRLEAEIEVRARELAETYYTERGWQQLRDSLDPSAEKGADGAESSETSPDPCDDYDAGEWPRTPLMAFEDELPPKRQKRRIRPRI